MIIEKRLLHTSLAVSEEIKLKKDSFFSNQYYTQFHILTHVRPCVITYANQEKKFCKVFYSVK